MSYSLEGISHTGGTVTLELGIDATTSEKDFQKAVMHTARQLGWLVHHTWDSRTSNRGFPDLVMVRNGRLLFAELKSAKGKVRPPQEDWLRELRIAHEEVYLWRPQDWDEIIGILN